MSRAMTDVGNFQPRRSSARFATSQLQRSPRETVGESERRSPNLSSFRESLAARRANAGNAAARDENARVSSLSLSQSFEAPPRRRWARESTPPVLEERENSGPEGDRDESRYAYSQAPSRLENSKRRLASAGHRYSSARTLELATEGRERRSTSTSLAQRRREAGLAVE